jgi:hypothetical protein
MNALDERTGRSLWPSEIQVLASGQIFQIDFQCSGEFFQRANTSGFMPRLHRGDHGAGDF